MCCCVFYLWKGLERFQHLFSSGAGRVMRGCMPFSVNSYSRVPGQSRGLSRCMYLCLCVFFPFILDIKFVGRTSRGHTGGRSHRISHPPSFCGACLNFSVKTKLQWYPVNKMYECLQICKPTPENHIFSVLLCSMHTYMRIYHTSFG